MGTRRSSVCFRECRPDDTLNVRATRAFVLRLSLQHELALVLFLRLGAVLDGLAARNFIRTGTHRDVLLNEKQEGAGGVIPGPANARLVMKRRLGDGAGQRSRT